MEGPCGKEYYWRFYSGKIVEIPEIGMRKESVVEMHERLEHRGLDSVYYGMKDKWYWPGMKETIAHVTKRCEICQINNRKKTGGSEFVETTRVLEKLALDLMDTSL